MCSFSDEECENMIELIRQNPSLYNARLESYKDEHLKDNIWISIGEMLNKTDSECRKKWKLIRDSYNRYKRKQKKSSGTAPPGKNSKWKLYERLRFLENTPSERLSTTNVKQEVPITSSEFGHEDTLPVVSDGPVHNSPWEFVETVTGTSKSTKRKRQQDDEFLNFLKDRHENISSKLETLKSQESVDDVSTFTKHIEMMLRKLSARSRAMAKTEIFSIVSKYEFEDIDGQSDGLDGH